MKKKVVILIDGQNLYYNLRELKFLEKDICWTKLLKSFIDDGEELVRTYWFRPQRLLDTYYTESNIKNQIVYKKYKQHITNFTKGNCSNIPEDILCSINEDCKSALDWIKKQKDKFSTLEYSYDQITIENDDIEIVKSGVVKINPYDKIYIGEKGVDISLAVKMISLSVENKCDKVILISGDFDYAEAIKYVKSNMTKVSVVKIHKGYPPRNKSMSRDLTVLADKVIDLYESDISNNFLKLINEK